LYDPERAKLYREHAAQILRWADQSDNPELRSRLLAIAAMYHRLAKHLEDDDPERR
jgi:hypothetical protein